MIKPTVKSAPGRKSVVYSGFVISPTGDLILNKPEWFNFKTVVNSFRKFIKEYPSERCIYLILANAPWHKKAVRLIQKEALPEYQGYAYLFYFFPRTHQI